MHRVHVLDGAEELVRYEIDVRGQKLGLRLDHPAVLATTANESEALARYAVLAMRAKSLEGGTARPAEGWPLKYACFTGGYYIHYLLERAAMPFQVRLHQCGHQKDLRRLQVRVSGRLRCWPHTHAHLNTLTHLQTHTYI